MEVVEKRSFLGLERKSEVEIEDGLDTLAFVLDDLFRIPGIGWRFGIDAVIGLVPVAGDSLAMLASIFILVAGVRYGVPKITLFRMALNVAIGYLVGIIPIVGDAFDFFWKPNKMNMKLIRKRAVGEGKSTLGDYLFILGLVVGLLLTLIISIIGSGIILYLIFTSRPLI